MRKYLRFHGAHAHIHEVELAPLTYEEFKVLGLWTGDSEQAYEAWKSHNNFVSAGDYRPEVLADAQLVICSDAPIAPDRIQFDLEGEGDFVTVNNQEQPKEFGRFGVLGLLV